MGTKQKRGIVVTRKEAAGLLRKSIKTVDRLIASGDIVAKKGSRSVYVLEWSIDAYLDSLPAVGGGK